MYVVGGSFLIRDHSSLVEMTYGIKLKQSPPFFIGFVDAYLTPEMYEYEFAQTGILKKSLGGANSITWSTTQHIYICKTGILSCSHGGNG